MQRSENLITTGKEVYTAYLLLDMVNNGDYATKNAHFKINGKKETFNEYVCALLQSGQTEADFNMGPHKYHIELHKKSSKQWDIKLSSKDDLGAIDAFKPIHEQTPASLIKLAEHHALTLHQEGNAFTFSADLKSSNQQTVRIGGPGKINLYQLHVSNLYALIKHWEDPTSNHHALVDMATGTGKSYTQALLFMILRLENRSCKFATETPVLAQQLKKCFEKLLPDELVQEDENWAIMSHMELLLDEWEALQAVENPNEMFLVFDEEHRATAHELLKKRMSQLANRHPLMFLSATPSTTAYQLCANKALTSLSRKEKEALGISKPAVIEEIVAEGLVNKNQANNLGLGKKLAKIVVDALEPERVSVAHEYVDRSEVAIDYRDKKDPFYATSNDMRFLTRWNLSCPVSEKALILADAHDPVVNLALLSQKGFCLKHLDAHPTVWDVTQCDDNTFLLYWSEGQWRISEVYEHKLYRIDNKLIEQFVDNIKNNPLSTEQLEGINQLFAKQAHALTRKNAYENGNKVGRGLLYRGLFQFEDDLDELIVRQHHDAQLDLRQQGFIRYLGENGFSEEEATQFIEENVDFGDTAAYLEHRVLHGLIDFTVMFLTAYEQKELDAHRFSDLSKLVNEVRRAVNLLNPQGEVMAFLVENKIPPGIAAQIAPAMLHIINTFKSASPKLQREIVDNWHMDKGLHQLFSNAEPIKHFTEKHKTIFLVNGLEKSPTAIQSDRPFYTLNEKQYAFDHEKVSGNTALKHNKTALEASYDGIKQVVYTPDYCSDEYSEEVVDTLFRNNLLGAYVSSKKTIGFNDPNLDHLSILIDSKDDPLNLPDNIVQGMGRLRGENWAKQPHVFVSTKKNVPLSFPTKLLNEGDFYSVLHSSNIKHQKELAKKLGEKIAEQMKVLIEANLRVDGHIDNEALEKKCQDIILTEFELIYNHSDHDFEKTKQVFSFVLKDVYQAFSLLSDKIKHTHHTPFLHRVFGSILTTLAKIYYQLLTLPSYIAFVKAARDVEPGSLEATYAAIIRHYSYVSLAKTGIVVKLWGDHFQTNIQQAVDMLMKQPNLLLAENKTELYALFSKSIGRFIKSPELHEAIESILSPLSDIDLIGLLDTLYPAQDNQQKLHRIKEFALDLKNASIEEIIQKYVDMTTVRSAEDVEFNRLLSSIFQLYNEIFTAHCYYHDVDKKATPSDFLRRDVLLVDKPPLGKFFEVDNPLCIISPNGVYYITNSHQSVSERHLMTNDPKKIMALQQAFGSYSKKTMLSRREEDLMLEVLGKPLEETPALKQSENSIWTMKSTSSHSFLTNFVKKVQFAEATSASFGAMNSLHTIANQNVIKTMEKTAEEFIKPLTKAFEKGEIKETVPSVSSSSSSFFKTPGKLGKRLHDMQPLSEDEVNSPETTYLNPICR